MATNNLSDAIQPDPDVGPDGGDYDDTDSSYENAQASHSFQIHSSLRGKL